MPLSTHAISPAEIEILWSGADGCPDSKGMPVLVGESKQTKSPHLYSTPSKWVYVDSNEDKKVSKRISRGVSKQSAGCHRLSAGLVRGGTCVQYFLSIRGFAGSAAANVHFCSTSIAFDRQGTGPSDKLALGLVRPS